ncbi:DNA/RNA non-specific endonuclease, partial [Andreprevotia lacus DSM 23236]
LKKAEEDAAKKQAEEAAKKSKPHEPQKEGKPEGEGSPGDGAKINPKKKLPPNAEFELNGYKYKTDSKGRVVEVKGQLKDESAARNNYAQRTVGKGEGRLADDHGGHLIGSQFGGSGEKANLVPMHKDINNYHSGEWGQMEKKWASALEKGESVEVKIMPKYTDDTMRPSSFSITEKIGDKIRKIDIENPVK